MKVALGIAATESEVTAALVDIDLPSLGPVDERITPLNAKSATVGDAVAAAIGVMRLRAIQNGLDLQSTMVSSATRVQRESISSALGMHKIEGVDVVDAADLSSAFEPSVATALWNAQSADLATADSSGSVKPVKASRMEKFGRAHRARSAEKAASNSESQRSDVQVAEQAPIPRKAIDLEKPSRTVRAEAESRTPVVAEVAEPPSLIRPPTVEDRPSIDSTSEAPTVSKAELDIPFSIASPPAAENATAETKPAEPEPAETKPDDTAKSLNLGDEFVPERVWTNGSAAVKGNKSNGNGRTYSGVSSHADTTETTVIDSAAIVAAVGDRFLTPAAAPVPAPAARRRLRPPVEPKMDEWDAPMTVPIGIVGPMATRASEVGTRERGAALIVGGVLALVFAALVAAWALSGGNAPETDAPGNAGVTGPLTSETSAAVVPPASTSVAVPGPVAPSSTNLVPETDTGNSTGELIDPSVDVEGAPAAASPTRSTRAPSERTGSSSVATNEVSAPVIDGSVTGRPATGGGGTVPTKATANPVATPVETAPSTVSTDPVTPTDPSTSGQTGAGGGNSGGGGSGGDLSPPTSSDE